MGDYLEFNIEEFDMNQVGDNKVLIFIGKRHTGKSVLAVDYLYHNQDFAIGTCISPTDEYNKTFHGKVPSMFIHEEFTSELLEKFVHRQKIITKRKENDPKYSKVDNRAFLIMDDCLYDAKNWTNDKNIRFIFMNGRHVGITFLVTMQYLLGIPPNLRSNVDYIFICKETKNNIKKKLYEYYAGMFPNYEMFNQILNECTKEYGCLVIDNTTTSDKLEDQVFWYRADPSKHKSFKLCDEMFWRASPKPNIVEDNHNEMNMRPNYDRYRGGGRSKPNFNIHRMQKNSKSNYDQNHNASYNPDLLYN